MTYNLVSILRLCSCWNHRRFQYRVQNNRTEISRRRASLNIDFVRYNERFGCRTESCVGRSILVNLYPTGHLCFHERRDRVYTTRGSLSNWGLRIRNRGRDLSMPRISGSFVCMRHHLLRYTEPSATVSLKYVFVERLPFLWTSTNVFRWRGGEHLRSNFGNLISAESFASRVCNIRYDATKSRADLYLFRGKFVFRKRV